MESHLPASQRVVVTGLGVVASLGHDVDSFWKKLLDGQCGIDRVTLFVTTHFMDEAERCNTVAYIYEGRLLVQGKPEELRNHPVVTPSGTRRLDLRVPRPAAALQRVHALPGVREGTLAYPFGSFAPVVDGKVLPQHPFDPVAPQISADIPLMIGSNRTEATLFNLRDQKAFNLDEAGLQERVTRLLSGDAALVIDAYRKAHPAASPAGGASVRA